MRKSIIVSLIIVMFFFLSCEKSFKYDEKNTRKIDVTCFIKANDTIKVNVSYSYKPGEFIEYINDADVYIYEGDEMKEKLAYKKNYFQEGWYFSEKYLPEENKNYRLVVFVPNYDTIYATTHIPKHISIDSIVYDTYVLKTDSDEIIEGDTIFHYSIFFDFKLHFKDNLDAGYYVLNADYLFSSSDAVIEAKNKDGYFSSSTEKIAFFNDNVFNGQNYSLRFSYQDPNYMTIDTLTLKTELQTVSKEAYLFFQTAYLQRKNRDNPLVEPVIIYSNIKNGVGIFAGVSSDSKIITYIK